MAENKKSFILYADLINTVSQLPDDKAGQLFKHILEYVNDANPITDDILIKIAFEPIKLQLKRDLKKWESNIEQRRQAGLRSAESRRAKKNESERSLTVVESRSTDSTVTDNVTVTVTDNVTDKKNTIEVRKKIFATSLEPFLDKYGREMLNEFFSYWTEHGSNDKKMRFEKQRSFGIGRRLGTWNKNNSKFNEKTRTNNRNSFASDTTQRTIDSIEARIEQQG